MGDSEMAQQNSKKRCALKQLSRENPGLDDEEDSSQLESGTFQKASDEVLASRKIVKVQHKEPSASPAAEPNPFSDIQLVPATSPAAETVVEENQKAVKDGRSDDDVEAIGIEKVDAGEEIEKTKDEDDNQCRKKSDDEVTDTGDQAKLDAAEGTDKTADNLEKDSGDNQTEKEGKEGDETVVEGNHKAVKDGRSDDGVEAIGTEKDDAGEETEETKDEDDNQCRKKSDDQLTDDGDQTVSGVAKVTDKTAETLEKEKEGDESKEADKNGDTSTIWGSFKQHSGYKNAFTGLATTDTSASPFSFGSTSSASLFSNTSSLFTSSETSITNKPEGTAFPPKQEVSIETGEENEEVAFAANSVLFEYLDGTWKERGKGEIKVNVTSNGGKARLVMRSKGNYRLILNANLYPEMKLASMDQKGITFSCLNSVSEEDKDGLSTFALKFKDPITVEQFRVAIDEYKEFLPENSPTNA